MLNLCVCVCNYELYLWWTLLSDFYLNVLAYGLCALRGGS